MHTLKRSSWLLFAALGILGLCIGFGSRLYRYSEQNSSCGVTKDTPSTTPGVDHPPGQISTDVKAKTADSHKRALLIGVTKYDVYRSYELEGPSNDVELTRQTLIDMYGFPKENITSLSESQGKADLRPTRGNIEREFAKLAKEAQEGDQIFILMAGHGSQQPQSKNTKIPEQDGLDEIFLPADIQKWDAKNDRMPNAIIDDEIGEWLEAITAKKAYVWAVFDCCHSGNITRGTETLREIRASALIPEAALKKAQEGAMNRPGRPKLPGFLNAKGNSQYLIALSACASHEVTPEGPQPDDDSNNTKYGLLSYTLNSIMRTSAVSGNPLTYAELTKRIQVKYTERMKTSPTPNIEGNMLQRFLFDTKEVKRPPYVLTKQKTSWIVDAGDLHGITVGSVLGVYNPAGEKDSNTIIGYVKVLQSRPLDSVVSPTEYEGVTALIDLPIAGRCEPVFINYALRQLKVALRPALDKEGKPVQGADLVQNAMTVELKRVIESKKEGSAFKLMNVSDQPDFVIECAAQGGELLDASGISPPIPVDVKAIPILVANLETIHRARNLLAVAARLQDQKSTQRNTVEVNVEMIRIREGKEESLKNEEDMVFRAGDRAAFKITNRSPAKSINVALLIVRTNGEIAAFSPAPSELYKAILPGESFTTAISGKFTDEPPFGLERVVAIAALAANPSVDFRKLTQPALRERGFDDTTSPLAMLLDSAMYNTGKRGGFTTSEVKNQAMQVLTYRVVPFPKK